MDTVRVLSSVLVIILAVHSSPSDSLSIEEASNDYGNIVHVAPSAVLSPSSVGDVIRLVNSSYASETPFTVAARGQAHSVRGQAMSPGGVVVDMAGLSRNDTNRRIEIRDDDDDDGPYADVGGEVTWIDVLRATAERGLAPVTWTDYLYLSVGGTLSNAGISGQAFRRGPHISNVVEMDVVTGKGEFMTCSKNKHQELFFSVLGGLGQFGIITRARIPLAIAPTRVKWARVIYTDFASFSSDQERLISGSISKTPDYVEGFLIADADTTNEWRSSFSTPSRQSDIVTLLKKQPILYSIELVKYYYHDHRRTSAAAQKVWIV
ncbi:cytokinin oxidase [Genlisea aurea]|uniref:cytokinin dehydrogenase n=1 Tax=Genlisea aurea TaxID=192259 RepID=S8BZ65_9LAMI|nr:cytokinin oxidase [Genlisea aurea]